MKFRTVICFVIAIGLLAASAEAARWIVPAGAHATGAEDTNWRTDLRMVNGSDAEVTVTVYLLRAKQDNSALDSSASYTIPAGGQVVVGDIFFAEWSFDGTGALLIDCASDELVVTSRTYNLLSDGKTYGQFLPGVPVEDALQPGEEGHIIYLAKSDIFRSNLGFAATTDEGGKATIDMYDEFGAHIGSRNRTFLPYDQRQLNDIFDKAGAPPSTAARAVVTTDAPIVAYGSTADIGTGDPVAVMAERAEVLAKAAATELAITAVARASGAFDSLWRTDIRIYNPGTETAIVELAYHKQNTSKPNRPSETFTIGVGHILALDDAMASGFGLDSANGALMISSDQPILAWSRTYNQAPIGISGQSIPAVPVGMATETTEWKRLYTGLNNVEGRSNAGFFNLSDDSITVDITMKDSSGAVAGEGEYELRAGEKKQINDIFAHLGVSAKNGGYYSLMIEGMGDLASYVSIANVLSSDPVYEAGVEEITGGGGGGGGGAACVDIPLVSDGTLSDYDLYAIEEGLTALGTVTIENVSTTQTRSEIHTVTDVMVLNFHVVDTRDVVEHYRILDDPMGFDELERVETSSETDNNGSVSTEDKTETYSPAKLRGPVTHACVGQTWTVPSVTLTTDIVGEGSSQESTPTMDGEVVAVDELLTTPAGTFTTLHWREATTSGDDAGTVSNYWNDVATGLLLMSRTQAPNQVIIRELELLSTE